EQLQLLYQRYESEGRSSEMNETLARMRAIDPAAEPRSGGGTRNDKSSELVFLDLSEDSPKAKPGAPAAAPHPAPAPAARPLAAAKPRPPGAAPASPQPSASGSARPAAAPRAAPASQPARPAPPAEEVPPLDTRGESGTEAADQEDDLLPM